MAAAQSLLGYSRGITAPPPGSAVSVTSAVLIAVDESDDLPPAPFADDEVRTLAGHLERVGVAKARQTLLVGPAATRSAAESRLRRLGTSLKPGDTAWFVFAGPAFHQDGRGFLACADTLADDRAATALAVADVVHLLGSTGATVHFLLDAPGLSDDELADLFPAEGPAAALTAAEQGQPSQAAGGRRLWMQLVGDALAGQAPAALDADQLRAGPLNEWVAKELPRAVRKIDLDPDEADARFVRPAGRRAGSGHGRGQEAGRETRPQSTQADRVPRADAGPGQEPGRVPKELQAA